MRDAINNHLGKELFLLKPLVESDPVVRTLFVSKTIQAAASPPWPRGRNGDRHAQMRAWLDTFASGRRISVAEEPRKKPRTTFMARTDPKSADVFDIRCINPIPGIRVLGRFSEKDTFVALKWDYRENMNGSDFDDAVIRCADEWKRLFPGIPLFAGRTLDDYLTNFVPV
jgi:hypothetical protein